MRNKLFALVAAIGVASSAFAADAVNYKQALSSVSVLEMPVKAAQLVSQTAKKDREIVTSAVVKNAAALKPTALPAVVGAIAKSTPEMAATAAAVAASEQPNLATAIAQAAAFSAPAQAIEIAKAISKALPDQARQVALAISTVAPKEAANTLREMANEASASTTTVAANTSGTTPPPRPPTVGAPYNPLPPGTPGQGSVTNSGVVPGGGRNYASP